ncbi:2OG-Fe(II) oxygenase [Thalassospira sp. SM2505]
MSLQEIKESIIASFKSGISDQDPYQHWFVENVLPADLPAEVCSLPILAPVLEVDAGTREANNSSRRYFDQETIEKHPVANEIAQAIQSQEVVDAVEEIFGADLSETRIRLEFAQDREGFWLQPHTDIGVKRFTMLLYLSNETGHEKLGTDIYRDAETHVKASRFFPNSALIFVPANNTWHGFEKRTIPGIRKSLIINYVTKDWRAVEQLPFPDEYVK